MNSFFDTWLPRHSSSEDLLLYHYTNLEGLKGIINSRSIWFTHASTLNDPTELKYGKQLILNSIEKVNSNIKDRNIKELLDGLTTNISAFDTVLYHTYVACFCKSENLLSQWRSYAAQGGGYNLGLRFKTDTKFYHASDKSKEETHVILRKMIYDVEEQKQLVMDYISSITSSAEAYLKKPHPVSDGWGYIAAMESVNILFDLMLSFKNPVFREENEWRLIIGKQDTHRPELLKFREVKESLIPYIEMHIAENSNGKFLFPLRSIKFGPMLDEARTKSALKLYINKQASLETQLAIDANAVEVSGAGYVLRQ